MAFQTAQPNLTNIPTLRARIVAIYCLILASTVAGAVTHQLFIDVSGKVLDPIALRRLMSLGLIALFAAWLALTGKRSLASALSSAAMVSIVTALTLRHGVTHSVALAAYVGVIILVSVGNGPVEVLVTTAFLLPLGLLVYLAEGLYTNPWPGMISIIFLIAGTGINLAWFLASLHHAINRLRAFGMHFHRLSLLDPLTALGNRRQFEMSMRQVIAITDPKNPATLLVLDLNHLKRINDLFGHPSGDQALRAVANAIRNSIRDTDIGTRIGGDEFAVILPNGGMQVAEKVAERIHHRLKNYRVGKERKGKVSVSMGIVEVKSPTLTPEEVLALADSKLYKGRQKHTRKPVKMPQVDGDM